MNDKKILSESFLNTLKESAIDCVSSQTNKCFNFPMNEKNKELYELDYKKAPQETRKINVNYQNIELIYEGNKKMFVYDKTNRDMAYLIVNKKYVPFRIINGTAVKI